MIEMVDISSAPLAPEDDHIQQAADEAMRVLNGEEDDLASARTKFSVTLRRMTREAPLHSLAIAFLLGVLITRRR
jgi:hypothetical protein